MAPLGKLRIAPALLVTLAFIFPARSGDGKDVQRDQAGRDAVRSAVERGDIRPLNEVLRLVRPRLGGEVVGVEIEREGGTWIYEFRVADRQGRLIEVYVDAATAEIVKTEEK
jgi:uncharacterized membrane protein YkoI